MNIILPNVPMLGQRSRDRQIHEVLGSSAAVTLLANVLSHKKKKQNAPTLPRLMKTVQ